MDEDLLFKDEVYNLAGAGMEVYNEMGNGYQEPVYQESYEKELRLRKTPFVPQMHLRIYYKGELLQKTYQPDVVAHDKIIVELKVLPQLTNREVAQVINYLKASKLQVGLLLNFGAKDKLEWRRIVFTHRKSEE
jgi:GxxExxY protein